MTGDAPKLRAFAQALCVLVATLAVLGSGMGVAGAGNVDGTVGTAAGGEDWPTLGHDEHRSGYSPDVTGPREPVGEQWKYGSSDADFNVQPVVANGTVYATDDDGNLHAISAADGSKQWINTGEFNNESAVAVTDGVVFARNATGVVAVTASTQAEIWFAESLDPVGSPTVVDGSVFIGNSDGVLFKIDANTGDVREIGVTNSDSPIKSSPTVVDDHVIAASTNGLYGFSRTGSDRAEWENTTIDPGNIPLAGADGTIFVATWDDELHAVNASDGDVQWTAELDGNVDGPLVATSEAVFVQTASSVGGEDSLSAFDADTGTQLWNVAHFSPVLSGARYALVGENDRLYAQTGPAGLVVYDTDGNEVWNVNGPAAPPAVTDHTLYAGWEDGSLRALTTAPIPRADRSPSVLAPGERVTLDASPSTPRAGSIESFEWDVDGDGSFERDGEQIDVSVQQPGGRAVSLRVTNSEGGTNTTNVWVPVANPSRDPLYDDWSTPAHDPAGTGTARATGIVGDLRERWNRSFDAIPSGTSLVVNDTVVFQAGTEANQTVRAVNASTGVTKWTYSAGGGLDLATESITAHGGSVYVGMQDGTVARLDGQTGTETWTQSLDSTVVGQPVVTGETLAVGTDGEVDVIQESRTIYWLDLDTGEVQRESPFIAGTGVTATDGMVYVGTPQTGDQIKAPSTVYGLNGTTPTEAWHYHSRGDVSTVSVRDGTVYGTNDEGDAFAVAADTETERWNVSLPSDPQDPIRPTVGPDTVLTVGEDTVVARYHNGTHRWSHKMRGPIEAPPTLVNGTVYVGATSAVTGLNVSSGDVEWRQPIEGSSVGSPAVVGDRFYLSTFSEGALPDGLPGRLYAFEGTADTGPSAALTASATSASTGEQITFDATNATDDVGIARTRWDFDDGTTKTGPNVTHSFDSGGTYDVQVTVVDTAGYRATETVTVSVSGGSGGGGAAASVGDQGDARVVVPVVDEAPDEPGTTVALEESDAVEAVTFDEETVTGDVVVTEHDDPSADLTTDVAAAVTTEADSVESENAVDVVTAVDVSPTDDRTAASGATVTLTVDADRIDEPGDAVIVHETDGGIEVLETSVEQSGDRLVLSADVDSFSTFAVVTFESTATQTGPSTTTTQETTEPTEAPTVTDTPTAGSSGPGFGLVAVLIAIGCVCALGAARAR